MSNPLDQVLWVCPPPCPPYSGALCRRHRIRWRLQPVAVWRGDAPEARAGAGRRREVRQPPVPGKGRAVPPPHLRRDWARPCLICAGTGLDPATSAPGLGSTMPHLRRDWVRPCHICTGTARSHSAILDRWRPSAPFSTFSRYPRPYPAAAARRAPSSLTALQCTAVRTGRDGTGFPFLRS